MGAARFGRGKRIGRKLPGKNFLVKDVAREPTHRQMRRHEGRCRFGKSRRSADARPLPSRYDDSSRLR